METQNALLMSSLLTFYEKPGYLEKMMHIINGESRISLRIIDWFVTNYAKKYYTAYEVMPAASAKKVVETDAPRVRVYKDYKLKLKAYNKRRFDPFCRWERIVIPYDKAADTYMETTLGQLNFFKWAIEMCIIEYIDANYVSIERDMNERNTASRKRSGGSGKGVEGNRTRKTRAEPVSPAASPVSSCGV
jgi:hypothetical protein